MIERLESVIRQLTSTDDARGVARRRIAEVVHAAYASGADVRDDRMLREVAAASLGVDVRTHDELLLTLRSNAARVSTNAPLCDALLNDVAARRARMGALLAHFGQTTSTSVAR
jgi:ketopantoate reductase